MMSDRNAVIFVVVFGSCVTFAVFVPLFLLAKYFEYRPK